VGDCTRHRRFIRPAWACDPSAKGRDRRFGARPRRSANSEENMEETIHKKFISTVSLQVKPEDSVKTRYTVDPSCKFEFDGDTRNPILPFIYNNAQEGETIGVYLIQYPLEQVKGHTGLFVEELREMEKKIGFKAQIEYLQMPEARGNSAYLTFAQELFEVIKDNDVIYMDITYGEKPLPIIQSLVLTYAQNMRKGVEIGALSYGSYDFKTKEGKLYDYTAIPWFSKFIVNIANRNEPERLLQNLPESFIEQGEFTDDMTFTLNESERRLQNLLEIFIEQGE
jgi:hypothetical protein